MRSDGGLRDCDARSLIEFCVAPSALSSTARAMACAYEFCSVIPRYENLAAALSRHRSFVGARHGSHLNQKREARHTLPGASRDLPAWPLSGPTGASRYRSLSTWHRPPTSWRPSLCGTPPPHRKSRERNRSRLFCGGGGSSSRRPRCATVACAPPGPFANRAYARRRLR